MDRGATKSCKELDTTEQLTHTHTHTHTHTQTPGFLEKRCEKTNQHVLEVHT